MRIGIMSLAMTAAVALSVSASVTPAAAASAGVTAGTTQQAGVDELSAARRRHARIDRHYRGGNPAAAQAFGAIAGTIGGIVAAEQARRYYYRPYGYGYYGYGAPYGGYYAPYGGYGYYGY